MKLMHPPFTLADYRLLPEGFPAQLVDGMLVREPAPRYGHQQLASRIHVALAAVVGPDLALQSPIDVVLGDTDVFQPDLAVLDGVPPADARHVGVPRLVCEVLSPSARRRDLEYKSRRYLAAGVREVWLVDPAERWIEIRTRDRSTRHEGRAEARSDAVPGFVLVPEALFARP